MPSSSKPWVDTSRTQFTGVSNHSPGSEAVHPLSQETIYGILAHHRRRVAVACLDEHGPLALGDLADVVASAEHDKPVAEISEDEVLDVHVDLWHSHIPKLAEANVVELEQEREIVRLAENGDAVAELAWIDSPTGGDSV